MLKKQLELCIHTMKSETHPETLVNVANGSLATPQVNVYKAVTIGYNQLRNLPAGYLDIGNP